MAKESVKCPQCEQQVLKSEGIFDDSSKKWLHPDCYKILDSKRELSRFVCVLFKLKAPGPKIYSQMNMLYKKGYSYHDMLTTLQYHFDVKKNKVEKAMEGIGIIPYVFDEAQTYYRKIKNKSNYLAEQIAQSSENQQRNIIYIDEKNLEKGQKKNDRTIDLNNL